MIRKLRSNTLLNPIYTKHDSQSIKHYITNFKCLNIYKSSKTVAMIALT